VIHSVSSLDTWRRRFRQHVYIQIKSDGGHGLPRGEACTWFWWGNPRERDHWGVQGVDGRIIFGSIFRNWDVGIWTGSSWLRIGTGGGHL